MRVTSVCVAIVCLLVSHWAAIAQDARPVDRYGDPLPPGAQTRLGTIRLRHTSKVVGVAFSPDGKILASTGWDGAIRLWDPSDGKPIRSLSGTEDRGSFAVAFSPDGARLASVGEGGLVRLWDVATGKELFKNNKHEGRTFGVAFSPDGFIFASAGHDGKVFVWDVETGEELLSFKTGERIGNHHAVALSPNGDLLASGARKTIRLWNLETGDEPKVIENAHGRETVSLVFLPDGKSIITSGQTDYKVKVNAAGKRVGYAFSEIHMWDASSGEQVREFKADKPDGGSCSIAVSDDGTVLVSVHRDKIRIWDVESGKLIRTITDYINTFGVRTHGLAISPDAKTIAVRGADHTVRLYDTATAKRRLAFPESHEDRVWCLARSPDGKTLATGSGDQSVRLWSLRSGRQLRHLRFGNGNPTGAHAVAFSPEQKVIAAAGYHHPDTEFIGYVGLWRAEDGKPMWQKETKGRITACTFSPDGTRLATAAGLGDAFGLAQGEKPVVTVTVWDSVKGEKAFDTNAHQAAVRWLAFSPDGKTLTSADERMTVRRWDAKSGAEVFAFKVEGHQRHSLRSVAFGPDGKSAATSGLFGNLLLRWDLATGKELGRIKVENTMGSILAFSPDGRLLASGSIGLTNTTQSYDEAIHLWDSSGRELLKLSPNGNNVTALTFSSDGKRIISGMSDGTVLEWDIGRAYEALEEKE